MMTAWGLAAAKARLSEVVEQAEKKGPQEITRNGRPVAVIVSMEDWSKKTRPSTPTMNMADFFRSSPLHGSGIDLRRSRSKTRLVKF
jgi:prevent-host-death family protein